jgi:endonuclease/exonuclease/phosphatase family metal-dependent hydrolase
MSTTLKVCTFNLRVIAEVDGNNIFHNRKGRILDTIKENAPDIIGFQEAASVMKKWLGDELAPLGYTVVGCGRSADYRGESTCIAFKRDDFELIALETRWLSATPLVPGSRYAADQSSCPRVYTAATLKHKDSDEIFVFLNTHLDHKGKIARLLSAAQLIQYLSAKPYKFVLTGDFNARPDAPEIAAFTGAGLGIVDATSELGGTFHNFGMRETKSKIDYIFTNLACDKANSYIVPDESVEGVYISDHHPVCATVEI